MMSVPAQKEGVSPVPDDIDISKIIGEKVVQDFDEDSFDLNINFPTSSGHNEDSTNKEEKN